ncbi:MAG: ABC transporter permease [Candidatus Competibacteraceae bacterium]|nr:ABC transporter permease [Candidatus Competibacteraceae bacterium]
MDFSIITENIGLYFEGLWLTMQLVALSLMLGLGLAVPFAFMANSRNWLLSGPVFCFSYFFRGTPLLVQMFMLYYGAGQFEFIRDGLLWPILREAYWCALIAFTLNTAAYTTEILRGAIKATPIGEIEAAKACGMSYFLMIRRIVLPSAFRRALPAYGNEVIFMLHGSSLASVITLIDITGAARIINSRYYTPYEAFLTAAAFYLVLTFVIVFLFKQVERRWFAHLRPREINPSSSV